MLWDISLLVHEFNNLPVAKFLLHVVCYSRNVSDHI